MVLIISEIDGGKRRDVLVFNMLGELLTIDMYKNVIMVLQGSLAKLMVKTKPIIYQKFVMVENRWTVLFIKFQKAL